MLGRRKLGSGYAVRWLMARAALGSGLKIVSGDAG